MIDFGSKMSSDEIIDCELQSQSRNVTEIPYPSMNGISITDLVKRGGFIAKRRATASRNTTSMRKALGGTNTLLTSDRQRGSVASSNACTSISDFLSTSGSGVW